MDAKAKVVAWQWFAPYPDEFKRVLGEGTYRYSEGDDFHPDYAKPLVPLTDHEAAMAELRKQMAYANVRGGDWRDKLQRQCTEWGAYWRAPDAHGVELTEAQAIELLAEVLGVEVAIQRPCGVWPDGQRCTKAYGHQGPCD